MLQLQLFYLHLVAFSYERKNKEDQWKAPSTKKDAVALFLTACGIYFVKHSAASRATDSSPPGPTGFFFLFFVLLCAVFLSLVPTANHLAPSHPVLCIIFSTLTLSLNLICLFNTATATYKTSLGLWQTQGASNYLYFTLAFFMTSVTSMFYLDFWFWLLLMSQNIIGKRHLQWVWSEIQHF